MEKITVLAYYDRLSIFHSLKPLLFSKHCKRFKFTNSPDYLLNRDKNRVLIMFRWFIKPDKVDLELMKKLRKKYDRIAFFNGNAGGSIYRPEILPYVDLFFNKSLLRDRSLYKRTFYGDELFTEFYNEKYGVEDDAPAKRYPVASDEDLKKLRLSWNIGVTDFPNTRFRQRLGVAIAMALGPKAAKFLYHRDFWKGAPKKEQKKSLPIHGRIGLPSKRIIGYQRELILEKIVNNPNFLSGEVDQKQFNREIKDAKIILSPFGWGELCKRDFEAVYNRSLLFKPDMSHLETWPDIFIPDETYVPFKWDLSDMEEKAVYYLKNDEKRLAIVDRAFSLYKEQLDQLDTRFDNILKEIVDK